ncbi:UPF0547 protein C16orf87 homolog [Halyomorpha halys]|uniref:UPF0547 protein C16orf87 homolog n=1 Tax=Halyomorpha halys TaxID=286706 RepID=UPI0006D4DFEE|nr:UPF0547 protein C16orf87 homolog [Halyomorpha halys]
MINYMPSFCLMGKNSKTITKLCPLCEIQVAVACKSCPGCKHSFHNSKRLSLAQALHYTDAFALVSRRRTERVKREKPNYYDSSEFEKKVSKKRHERNSIDHREDHCRPQLQTFKKKRKKKIMKSMKEEDEEIAITLTNDKMKQCSIILAELNRKMYTTTWRR